VAGDLTCHPEQFAPQTRHTIRRANLTVAISPIAPSLAEAEVIVAAARRSKVLVGMCMGMLDDPLFHELKKMIGDGIFGRISAAYCRGSGNGGLAMPPGNWRGSVEKTGGGSFIQLAVHPINMAQWLLEDRIVRVAAFSKNLICPNVGGDDLTAAACEFASGILGTLESAYCAKPSVLAIYGTKGRAIVLPHTNFELRLEETYAGEQIVYDQPGESVAFTLDLDPRALYKRDNPFDQHAAFVKAVQEGKPAPMPVEAGLYDLKVVKAVYQSARERRFVEID